MKKIILSILFVHGAILGAKEADKTKESIDTMLQIDGYIGQAEKILQSMGSTLTVEQFTQKFKEAYEQKEFQETLKEMFEKKFTPKEREELYGFITSPLYKKCTPEIYAFAQEAMPLVIPILMQIIQEPEAAPAQETNKVGSINESNFDAVLQENEKVIVDVYAAWCGPCKALSPIFQQLSEEFEGKCTFVKLNADANQALMQKLKVKGLPTILVYKGGQEVHRQVGFANKDQLTEILNTHFSK